MSTDEDEVRAAVLHQKMFLKHVKTYLLHRFANKLVALWDGEILAAGNTYENVTLQGFGPDST
jgi:hypothetical protein